MIVHLYEIIASLESGVSVNGDGTPSTGDQPGVLKVSSVANGHFYPNENKAILMSEVSRATASLRAGDLLVSRANTLDLVGSSSLVDKDYPHLFLPDKLWRVVLRDPGRDCVDWLIHVLNSPGVRQELKTRATGTSGSMKNIPQWSFLAIRVYRPSYKEQKALAAVFSSWDRAIRQLADLITAKERFKRGLMQELLTGRRRFPEFSPSELIEHSIGDVLTEATRPVVWDESELYRLASIRRHSGGLFWREALYGNQIKVKKLHTLREGDFLISHIQAAYGAMGLVPLEFEGGTVSEMYSILIPKNPGSLDMRYVDYMSQLKRMRHQAYLASNGFFAERLRLNFDPTEFLDHKILLPTTVEEQRRICDFLDSLVVEIRLLRKQEEALKAQKKGLMQRLLTGEVRVKPPEEVA